jgi:hypothetical protein
VTLATMNRAMEFRVLVEQLVGLCNRGVALKASVDWKALRAHDRQCAAALGDLRRAVALARGLPVAPAPAVTLTEAPSREPVGSPPPMRVNGSTHGLSVAECRARLDRLVATFGGELLYEEPTRE